MTPEQQARVQIDTLLQQAGWVVCDVSQTNIQTGTGVAIREFPLNKADPIVGLAEYNDARLLDAGLGEKHVAALLDGCRGVFLFFDAPTDALGARKRPKLHRNTRFAGGRNKAQN